MRRFHIRKHYILFVAAAYSLATSLFAQDFADVATAAMDAIREARTQNAASSEVKAIFAKAIDAEEDGNINFCGFYTGMSKADAQTLADFYKLKPGEWFAQTLSSSTAVYELWFSLRSVRKLTKGGNTFDELAQAVANRIGTLEKEDESTEGLWWTYCTIDDVEARFAERTISEKDTLFFSHRGVREGLTVFDKKYQRRVEREQAERKRQEAERVETQIAQKTKDAITELAGNMVEIPGKGFSICKYEATQALWQSVMGENPSKFKGPDRPVESIGFSQIEEFLGKLNALPEVRNRGCQYRLPSMREWEYACRAGGSGDFCRLANGTEIRENTVSEVAWCGRESWEGGSTHPVGQKMPNAFGLYDMLGNVWEWVTDGKYGECTIRGGAYDQYRSECMATFPSGLSIDCGIHSVADDLGFRLAADKIIRNE